MQLNLENQVNTLYSGSSTRKKQNARPYGFTELARSMLNNSYRPNYGLSHRVYY